MHELDITNFERKTGFRAASPKHVAVMAEEVVGLVRACKPGLIVDATIGTGGHAERLLQQTDAHLLGIDRDADVLAIAAQRLGGFDARVSLRHANFGDLELILEEAGFSKVNAIICDLGMSSFALDDPERGFSFQTEGPLDMRMDRRQMLRAYDIVNEESEPQLARILRDFGEEHAARQIARAIVSARRRHPIESTFELAAVIMSVLGGRRFGTMNPATRSFQALRIAVNRELESLERFLKVAPQRLAPGGRLVILAYHSLEDRAVKQCFREQVKGGEFIAVSRKAIRPDAEEVANNRRARSARLRCIQRISG
jgi:16S rRNA (cytosine1402-N4)-methyltransferase